MSEESQKIEKAEKTEQEVKAAELSEEELNKIAGAGYTPPKAGQIDKGGKSW
ncbi:MAG: hypothetical protein ABSH49_33475 [Bryobacteraceae bacterium]|jgi:hypothetical protein